MSQSLPVFSWPAALSAVASLPNQAGQWGDLPLFREKYDVLVVSSRAREPWLAPVLDGLPEACQGSAVQGPDAHWPAQTFVRVEAEEPGSALPRALAARTRSPGHLLLSVAPAHAGLVNARGFDLMVFESAGLQRETGTDEKLGGAFFATSALAVLQHRTRTLLFALPKPHQPQ